MYLKLKNPALWPKRGWRRWKRWQRNHVDFPFCLFAKGSAASRGTAWLDTGTLGSLFEAAGFAEHADMTRIMVVNGIGPGSGAEAARYLGAAIAPYSADDAFGGTIASPDTGDDEPDRVNVGGNTNLARSRVDREIPAPRSQAGECDVALPEGKSGRRHRHAVPAVCRAFMPAKCAKIPERIYNTASQQCDPGKLRSGPMESRIKKPNSSDVVWHHATVTRPRREALNRHRSVNLWLTGLSGAGKSTLAHEIEERLHQMGCKTYVFDGDNVRHGLCGDLGFSPEDRTENIRRIAEMVKLFLDAGVIALTAFISPFRSDRQMVRDIVGSDFIEIYCRCPIEVCEERDVKGMYRRARAGEIKAFTGVSSPYEEPQNAELILDTGASPLAECVDKVIKLMDDRGVFENK